MAAGGAKDGDGGTSASLDPHRVDYVARRLLGLVARPGDELTSKTIPGSSVQGRLRLNKSEYEIGEPIAATFTVTNIGQQPIRFDTGCDYRSGREQRFSFDVTDENGRRAPDALAQWTQFGLQGGLGSEGSLGPGQSWSHTVLLNMYACPRTPGVYAVKGRYRYRDNTSDAAGAAGVQREAVIFRLLDRQTAMSDSALRKFQKKYGFDDFHPVLLWGVRGLKKDIPAILEVMRTGSTSGRYFPPIPERAKQCAEGCAALGLMFMPWKEDAYRGLSAAIAAGVPNEISGNFTIAYWSAAGPESVGAVEEHLDHPNSLVRQLALKTALSLGGPRASERLAEALRSPAIMVRDRAQEGASLYLSHTIGYPECRVEGLTKSHVEEYRSALMTATHDEPTTMILQRLVWGLSNGPEIPLDLIQRVQDEPDPIRRQCMLEPIKVEPLLLHRSLSKDSREALLSLLRAELERESVAKAQADAMIMLGFLGDEDAKDRLVENLSSANETLRAAAAFALFTLRDEGHLDACIDVLSANPHRFHMEFRELSRLRGMSSPGAITGWPDYIGRPWRAEDSEQFTRYFQAVWRRTLILMDEAVGGAVPRLGEVPEPSINNGQCPADRTHQWPKDNPLLRYAPMCPYCGEPLEMRSAANE
ncbi:MAG: hypothetical protein NTW86_30605 [Candidatus Sumerlaeota bacterium]|nr:hypothetical protein [Candidatus Sumerlaeota bacterium]